MPIIQYTEKKNLVYDYLAVMPDQYVSEKKKGSDDFAKDNMDFFALRAYNQYIQNRDTFCKNYDLVKGILHPEDFYGNKKDPNDSWIQVLQKEELPDHVKHYSILNPPINNLIGELSKRPDTTRVKAFDQQSRNEELAFRTDQLNQFVMQKVKQEIYQKLSLQGIDPSTIDPEQLNQMSEDEVKENAENYTSAAEDWANNILEASKMEYNLKEKSEDCFRDLLISGRERYMIVETTKNSVGIDVRTLNPKNYWELKSNRDNKYCRDAYALGTVEVMEMSQIIEEFPELTIKEIDHLRKGSENFNLLNLHESNYGNSRAVGINSINYNTYDPLVLREREMIESSILDGQDDLTDLFNNNANIGLFGNRFSVVRAWWISKRKVGKVNYIDPETQQEETMLVDENYKENSVQQTAPVEWSYSNQWFYGFRIGTDIYYVKPYKLLPYAPIFGVTHECKNTEGKSLVDLMKPFQMNYNVAANQIWDRMEKEIGVVYKVQLRRIPTPKDADGQDAIDVWEMEARERGIMFEDDSPENLKAAISNTQTSGAVDLTRSAEIQSRWQLMQEMKRECWELVGLSPERLGSVAASQTATGTNTAISQSYSQTEPYFVQHEYVLNELYQGIIDASQYLECNKPSSTVSYINSMGNNSFMQINGDELRMRDLKVYVTSRSKDQQAFQAMQSLAQPAIQNGASLYEVSQMYTTDSMRKAQGVLKKLKEKQDSIQDQQSQMQQQQLQQQQQQAEAQIQQQAEQHQADIINENYNKALDRNSNERKALIMASAKSQQDTAQTISSPTDPLDVTRLSMEQSRSDRDHQASLQKIDLDRQKLIQQRDQELANLNLEKEKLQVKREDIKSKEKIAIVNKNSYSGKTSKPKK